MRRVSPFAVLHVGRRVPLHKWLEAFAKLAPEIADLVAGAHAWGEAMKQFGREWFASDARAQRPWNPSAKSVKD